MPSRPLIVLADDLTGAAEVAAIAHEAGLRAVVVTQVPRAPIEADVLVLDTDTRLTSPARAARHVRAWAARLSQLPHAGVFKKTDSVLRGPVLAELQACATTLGFRRSLLLAGNPTLGRTIREGRCYIGAKPIDRTAFASDPHHPARSAAVLDLLTDRWSRGALAPDGKSDPRAGRLQSLGRTTVTYRTPDDKLPATGVIVGEHRSAADTASWVRAVNRHTLPAGGADFFRAWLQARSTDLLGAPKPPGEAGPTRVRRNTDQEIRAEQALLLHGTTASAAAAGTLFFNGLRAPPAVRVISAIRQRGAVSVAATPFTLKDPLAPAQIAAGFARLALELRDREAFRHLLIAGGATAATVLRALGWTRLAVVRVWSPGVVSLQPAGSDFTVTLKPGSYPWPAGIRRAVPLAFS